MLAAAATRYASQWVSPICEVAKGGGGGTAAAQLHGCCSRRFGTTAMSAVSASSTLPPAVAKVVEAAAAKAQAQAKGTMLSTAAVPPVHTWTRPPPLTKIVATIGPTSENAETLQLVVDAGMRVMRVNFSHATYEEAELRTTNLRKCKGKNHVALGRNYNLRAILLDTQGPEIRTGNLKAGGESKILMERGKTVELTVDPKYAEEGTAERIFVNYPGLVLCVQQGSTILLDDGLVGLHVLDVQPNSVKCLIENTHHLKSRRGVNIPGAKIDLPALSAKDMKDIRYGIKNDYDFVAASFVRKAQDVVDIRSFIEQEHIKVWPADHPRPLIVSKIENKEAVDNFMDILDLSDGIMVARGDLGVEIQQEKITNLQKWMVKECNRVGKPVIVATQMLESMQVNPRPTRAETSDVTNAVYDGADAVMLSGESAQGKYPVESVFMMRRIIYEAEAWQSGDLLGKSAEPIPFTSLYPISIPPRPTSGERVNPAECVAAAVVHAASVVGAKMILCLTKTGYMPTLVAKYRPNVPVVCYCPNVKVGRQLMLHRALHPIVDILGGMGMYDELQTASDADFDHLVRELHERAVREAKQVGFCKAGDTIVMAGEEPRSVGESLQTDVGFVRVFRVL